jgi:ankyrin repeat protein
LAVKLIENGACVNTGYPDGCNPLIKSGNYGYEKVAKALLEGGANVNVQSKNGNTGTEIIHDSNGLRLNH